MNFIEFKQKLQHFSVFSLRDIHKIALHFHMRRLVDWQRKGYIRKIIRGFYCFSETLVNEHFLGIIAHKIYRPSYLSLALALTHYQLIPESVYKITSVSTRKTQQFQTNFGTFCYRHLKPSLFFGYHLIRTEKGHYKMADLEKALLDFFYLNPHLRTEADFVGVRIDTEQLLKTWCVERFQTYLSAFANFSLEKRMQVFLRVIRHA